MLKLSIYFVITLAICMAPDIKHGYVDLILFFCLFTPNGKIIRNGVMTISNIKVDIFTKNNASDKLVNSKTYQSFLHYCNSKVLFPASGLQPFVSNEIYHFSI
jgi:hypothetical protein